jgi:hypothetical protein
MSGEEVGEFEREKGEPGGADSGTSSGTPTFMSSGPEDFGVGVGAKSFCGPTKEGLDLSQD